jgi:hypothetical protein
MCPKQRMCARWRIMPWSSWAASTCGEGGEGGGGGHRGKPRGGGVLPQAPACQVICAAKYAVMWGIPAVLPSVQGICLCGSCWCIDGVSWQQPVVKDLAAPAVSLHPAVPPPCHPHLRINNAGTNAYKYGPLLESSDDDLAAIVNTNVLGVLLCCKEVGGAGE